MKIQQILQKCLTDWKNISQIDFCLLDSDNHIFLSTCDKKLPAESKLEEFRQSSALCVSNTSCCLYKIMENHSISYILIVWGKAESTATIGELAYARYRVSWLPMQRKATRIPLCRIFSLVVIPM